MKSFIIKIELEDSEPLIWRRVIMPAGATEWDKIKHEKFRVLEDKYRST